MAQMINTWQPQKETTSDISLEVLERFAEYGLAILQEETLLNKVVSKEHQSIANQWLNLTEEQWQQAIANLPIELLYPLAAFFTLAEMQLPGWQCGAKNPAIWIFRWLRAQQQQPSKEQVQVLKKMTDNRFIPYGSVL